MPQNPLSFNTKNAATGAFEANTADSVGALLVTQGGLNSTLNVTAAAVIKATPGRVSKISVLGVVGTGGTFTLNDCATTGAATTANQVFSTAGTVAVGTILTLDFPFQVGIVVSAVPTGGTPRFAISYT